MRLVSLSVLAVLISALTLPSAMADVGLPEVGPCEEGTWVERAQCIVDGVAGPIVDLAMDVTWYAVGVAVDAAGVAIGVVLAIVDIATGAVDYVVMKADEVCHEAAGSWCDVTIYIACIECLFDGGSW